MLALHYFQDFNTLYEICYCCGLEVIRSGSKWCLFYCQDCKNRIRKLNEMMGRCIIPYGRHSMMNGVSLGGENAKRIGAIGEFVKAVNDMNNNIGTIEDHRKNIVKKQVKLLRLNESAPAIDLILKSDTSELHEMNAQCELTFEQQRFKYDWYRT